MSRRKQGRPQQRKTLDSLEQENDLLVCGDCQTSFALHDIVHFIKHKKQCCDKENVDTADATCRKPGTGGGGGGGGNNNNNNDNETNGERLADDENDDDEGVDMSKSTSRREEGDEASADIENENDESSMDASELASPGNGEKTEVAVKAEKAGKRCEEREKNSSSSRELRTPLRQKQVVDAESNTTHSEPSKFVCETCRSMYTSAWALLQHAQKEHGMKIYTSPSSSSNHHHSPSAASTPIPTVSPIDLVVAASSPRSGLDHRSVSSAGSGGSASPYPVHAPNPFTSPFRLPLDTRLPHSTSISPFSRAPSFDFDLINDYRLRPQLLARGASALDHPSFSHSPFDRTRAHVPAGLESHYDYYSMRLKQLASSPVHPKSQFSASSQPQPPSVAVTPTSSKSESPPLEASSSSSPRGSSLTSALGLPQKLKSCEFCGKSFRFQSNLVVHRRSHTGEKPYKCPLCPHACTQQSKLKRHMKTHSAKSEGETSPNGTPNHKDEEVDDEEEEEEEEDEEEEEEEEDDEDDEEDMIEEEMNDEEREVLERMKASKNGDELTPEPGEIRHAKRMKLGSGSHEKRNDDVVPSDLSIKSKPVESVLSEVMKHTGLTDIQTYNEAFQAALAESQENGKDKHDDKHSVKSGSRDGADSPRTASPKSPRSGVKRELESDKDLDKDEQKEHLFLGGTDLLGGKSVKRESSATSLWQSNVESLPNNIDPAAASLYSRIHHPWFHPDNPVRLFFPGYPPRFPHTRDLSLTPESHNGLNLSPGVATTSSALKSDSPSIPALFKPTLTSPPAFPASHHRGTSSSSSSPTGSLLLPSNGNSVITAARKDSRRNDTCEYCGKVFKNCSNLTVHRRSHTGEKPYKCNLCSYACAQSSKLTRHMKTHGRLGKDVYTCKFCNMPFSVPSTLEKHMRKCVENRNARLLQADTGDLSSESNGEMSRQSDSASGVY